MCASDFTEITYNSIDYRLFFMSLGCNITEEVYNGYRYKINYAHNQLSSDLRFFEYKIFIAGE